MLHFMSRLRAEGGNFNRAAVEECFDFMDKALREILVRSEAAGVDPNFPTKSEEVNELVLENERMRHETMELIDAYETLITGLRMEVVKVLRLHASAHRVALDRPQGSGSTW